MGLLDQARERVAHWLLPTPPPAPPIAPMALAERREAAAERQAAVGVLAKKQEGLALPFGMGGIDNDEYLYRRLTGDAKMQRRDLAPMAQDRMIEISNYLWEQNCFGRRLITLMTDLILGEGISVEATDARNQAIIDLTWNHRVNMMATRIRSFYNALAVNGELAIPVATNPISGVPLLGFVDPYQIARIETLPDNVLIPDVMILKTVLGQKDGQRLKIVREDPDTGQLAGEVFFLAINALPNSVRGRSDLLAVADWLDLYDQYMFAEVERLNLLSSFVWDYKIEGATTDKEIKDKLAKFPKPTPGSVFAHNEKESLEPRTPDLKAQDRSEVARMMRVHIAGSMGYPVSYLGDVDSNRATIEGQNDIMLKTPAARQKEFASFVDQVMRFAIENAQTKNRALFRDVQQGYKIIMPEISAKDISRVGSVVAQVTAGMDTALANRTMSRKAVVQVQTAVIKQLGVVLDPTEVMAQADDDQQLADDAADQRQADMAARGLNPNPPIPSDEPPDPGEPVAEGATMDSLRRQVEAIGAQMAALINRPAPAHTITVNPPAVNVEGPVVHVAPAAAPNVTVHNEAHKPGDRRLTREPGGDIVIRET